MKRLSWFGALIGLLMLWGGAARAEDPTPSPIEWQAVIAGQIQAFRQHDAPNALKFAGQAFHDAYADPRMFFLAIIQSGYAPIMESQSQTFGVYKMLAPDLVLQEVKLTGNDQSIYEAIYQLAKEADGWRVHGVQLIKTSSVGI